MCNLILILVSFIVVIWFMKKSSNKMLNKMKKDYEK